MAVRPSIRPSGCRLRSSDAKRSRGSGWRPSWRPSLSRWTSSVVVQSFVGVRWFFFYSVMSDGVYGNANMRCDAMRCDEMRCCRDWPDSISQRQMSPLETSVGDCRRNTAVYTRYVSNCNIVWPPATSARRNVQLTRLRCNRTLSTIHIYIYIYIY